mmetsp:Transcript_73073/g.209791  ORF Transcript_73073/g.209791 Transcript_73073/m.209791 type:complete len:202 (-) Transcript_73073:29-634(-)
MDVQAADNEVGVHLDNPVDVDQCQNEAPIAAHVEGGETGQVVLQLDLRGIRCMEDGRTVDPLAKHNKVLHQVSQRNHQPFLADALQHLGSRAHVSLDRLAGKRLSSAAAAAAPAAVAPCGILIRVSVVVARRAGILVAGDVRQLGGCSRGCVGRLPPDFLHNCLRVGTVIFCLHDVACECVIHGGDGNHCNYLCIMLLWVR